MEPKFEMGDTVREIGNSSSDLFIVKASFVDSFGDFIIIKDSSGEDIVCPSHLFELDGFKVGDEVICVDDSYIHFIVKGNRYTVNHVESDRLQRWVRLEGDGTLFIASRFIKAEPKKEVEKMEEDFKVGDIVRCIDNDGNSYIHVGQEYEITRVKEYTGGLKYVGVDIPGMSKLLFFASRFGLVPRAKDNTETKSSFEPGDIVRCINDEGNGLLHLGQEYEIARFEADAQYVVLKDPSLEGLIFFTDRFVFVRSPEKIKPEVPIIKTDSWKRIKAGDIVKCINDTGNNSLEQGKEYAVYSVSEDSGVKFMSVFTETGYSEEFFTDRFEFVRSKDEARLTEDDIGKELETLFGMKSTLIGILTTNEYLCEIVYGDGSKSLVVKKEARLKKKKYIKKMSEIIAIIESKEHDLYCDFNGAVDYILYDGDKMFNPVMLKYCGMDVNESLIEGYEWDEDFLEER